MPRADRTFTDGDLIRFYCSNLDPGEKYRVLRCFNLYLSKGEKICQNDPDRVDPCEWLSALGKIIDKCKDLSILLPKIIMALATLEMALSVLSWVGPLGRVLNIVRAAVAYLISVMIYVAAIMIIIAQFAPLYHFMQRVLCEGEKPLPLDKPPNLDDLPEDPNRMMDDIIKQINDFAKWIQDWLADNPGWDEDPTV